MMSVRDSVLQKNFKYHHGHLREALLSAALNIIQGEGIDGLSLRSLAKATGVSQAAPYAHFEDKEELLAAIAEKGFQQLALRMVEDAMGSYTPQDRIEKLMTSYIRFAIDNKSLFRLMFGREVSNFKKFPTLAMTAGKSYALISAALTGRGKNAEETCFLSVAIWSLCQGLTALIVEERLDITQFDTPTVEEFVKRTTGIFAPLLA